MIVFDLKCDLGHVFEAWFKNHDVCNAQIKAKEIGCIYCHSRHVTKTLSAPAIPSKKSISSNKTEQIDEDHGPSMPVVTRGEHIAHCTNAPESREVSADDVKRALDHMYETMTKFSRQVEKTCEYVGKDFAEQARDMHHGAIEKRAIYGETTLEETEELLEEGIDLLPVPGVGKLDS